MNRIVLLLYYISLVNVCYTMYVCMYNLRVEINTTKVLYHPNIVVNVD